jgi:hypothetical protein
MPGAACPACSTPPLGAALLTLEAALCALEAALLLQLEAAPAAAAAVGSCRLSSRVAG